MEPYIYIIALSFLGPLIGTLIGIVKKPDERTMLDMMALAGGVMLGMAFFQLIPESIKLSSVATCIIGMIIGTFFMYLVDRVIPHVHPELCAPEYGSKIKKTALFILVGMFIHNIPEGMAMAVGMVSNIKLSFITALSISLHHIPESICTAAPYFYITKNRAKSFLVSISTFIPLMVGFALGVVLFSSIPAVFMGLAVGATAAVMVYISIDELIPTSCASSETHSNIFFLMAGIIIVLMLGLL
jgi:ZIP family zinc transporter